MHHDDAKDTKDDKARANDLSHEVLGAAVEVHRLLGPGLLESTYETCLSHELTLRGAAKAVEALLPIHPAQVLAYLKLSGPWLGLLLNFNARRLKEGICRLAHERSSCPLCLCGERRSG